MPWLAVLRLFVLMLLFVSGPRGADAQALVAPWAARDIGAPALAGDASVAAGVFTIDGAGTDTWGAADQFHFVYQAVTGDVDVRVRIDDLSHAHAWSKAGVMIRGALTAGAPHAYALVSAGKGLAFQRRAQPGGLTVHTGGAAAASPYWIRMVRRGSLLSAYSSPDGAAWAPLGSDTIALGATAYVGIAVTSHNPDVRATARVSAVSVAPLSLPAGMASADIGGPALAGNAVHDNGTYIVDAAGADIWGSADQFHYVYRQASGDVDVRVHVKNVTYADGWSKAGVMIRETLAADSRHAYALASAGKGYAFQRRPEATALTDHTAGGAGVAPGWVRLVRKGNTFTAFRSPDGVAWTVMGSAAINMGASVYVGLAVTSHNPSALTTAVVDSLAVTESASANRPPVVTLTSPSTGAAYTAPATVTLTASAADPEGALDAVEFYIDGVLLGRVQASPYTLAWKAAAAGTYSVSAVAIDASGAQATSMPASVTVSASVAAPRYVEFAPSADHVTAVTSYLLEVFTAGANPTTATPVAASDLGKPSVANGVIRVDRSAFFATLPAGTYTATVVAVGPGGSGRSAPVSFSR